LLAGVTDTVADAVGDVLVAFRIKFSFIIGVELVEDDEEDDDDDDDEADDDDDDRQLMSFVYPSSNKDR
jgi:hypothetical protein